MTDRIIFQQNKKNKDFYDLYFIDVPVTFASVQEPKKKYQTKDEYEYAVTVFVTDEMRTYLEDEVIINKQFFKVGVDKNKKRKIKYPTSDQLGEGETVSYDDYKGLNGVSLTLPSVNKKGKKTNLVVLDDKGEEFKELVGNGSVCSIKCSGYRNQDDALTVFLNIVKVKEHVPYEGGNGTITDDVLGITYNLNRSSLEEPVDDNDEGEADPSPF